MIPFIGVCHAAALALLTFIGLRASRLDWITRANAAVVVGWANLVLTAIILSPFSALGRPLAFAAVSTGLAVLSAPLLARAGLQPLPPAAPLPSILDGRPRLA